MSNYWLLVLCTSYLVIIAVTSSPVQNEGDAKPAAEESAARQQTINPPAAASPAVAAPAPPANAPAESEDDDDDDDDDDDVVGGIIDDDDDDDSDDDEETGTAGGGTAASDDDDDNEEDDYDFEKILDDILGDDDEDDDEEEEEEAAASESVPAAAAAQAATAAPLTAVPVPVQGLAALPVEDLGGADQGNTNEEDEQVVDENNPHTVTLLTNNQPDEADEAQEQFLNTNEVGALANNAPPVAVSSVVPAADNDEEDDEEEEDEDEEDILGDDDEDEDEEEDDVRKSRSKEVGAHASYITKYNKYIDNIFGRINKVLKKNYNPVNVRLQTAPSSKQKTSTTKTASKVKRKPTFHKSFSHNDVLLLPHNGTQVSKSEPYRRLDSAEGTKHFVRRRVLYRRKLQSKASSSNTTKKAVRAKATLYGLFSLRRDGDVIVNVLNSHTTVKSKFFVGPLTLKVEKEVGRGAKRELRSAIATTAEMFGKLNMKVVHGGDASLSSIKVMQPKQLRVESTHQNDETSEFLWKRSGNLARVVSQKLTNAARSLLPLESKLTLISQPQ